MGSDLARPFSILVKVGQNGAESLQLESDPEHGLGSRDQAVYLPPVSSNEPHAGTSPESVLKSRSSPWEWIWQGKRERFLSAEATKLSSQAKLFMDGAQASLHAAVRIIQLQRAESDATLLVPAAELLKQSASFAALSILAEREEGRKWGVRDLNEAVWKQVSEPAGLKQAEEFWRHWLSQSNDELWDTPPSQQRLAEIIDATSKLVRFARRSALELDAIRFRRTYRIGVPLLLVALGAVILRFAPS